MTNLEIMKNYIDNPNCKSFVIDEEWGFGKTTEIKRAKDDLIKHYPNKKFVYIKISELISSQIKEICYAESSQEPEKLLKKGFSFFNEITKNIKTIQELNLNYVNNVADVIYKRELNKFNLDEYIIFIDEIERIEDGYDIKKFFNEIFELKESNFNINIFLIFNSKGFTEKNQLLYNQWIDKISDSCIKLNYIGGQEYLNIELKNLSKRFNSNIEIKTKEKNIRKIKNFFIEQEPLFLSIENKLLNCDFLIIDSWKINHLLEAKLNNKKEKYKINDLFTHESLSDVKNIDLYLILNMMNEYNILKEHDKKEYFKKIKELKNKILDKTKNEETIINIWAEFSHEFNHDLSLQSIINRRNKYVFNNLITPPDDDDFEIFKILSFFTDDFLINILKNNKKILENKIKKIKEKNILLRELKYISTEIERFNNIETNEFYDNSSSFDFFLDNIYSINFDFLNEEYLNKNIILDEKSISYSCLLFLIEKLKTNNYNEDFIENFLYYKIEESIENGISIDVLKKMNVENHEKYIESLYELEIENLSESRKNELVEGTRLIELYDLNNYHMIYESEFHGYCHYNREINENFDIINYVKENIIFNYNLKNLDKEFNSVFDNVLI